MQIFDIYNEKEVKMVSIKDVADQAGVAISTVSKVLNGYPNVSEKTKDKVNKVIKELGYVPNMAAAMLSSKQSGRIALLINPNIETQALDEIHMQYILGATNRAKENKLDIITIFFSMLRDMSVDEIRRYLKAQNIDGLIICGMDQSSDKLQKLIDEKQFKIVLIDAPIFNEVTSSIWVDNVKAQYDVAKQTVIGNDCHSILYIAGKSESFVTSNRITGITTFAAENNMQLKVVSGDFSEMKARKLTFQYGKDYDLIACGSDLMAIGAMKALTEMDIFHPVCGFDGITLMGYVGKQMNTVKQNFSSIASQAVDELIHLMSGKEGKNIIAKHELVRMKYEDIIR